MRSLVLLFVLLSLLAFTVSCTHVSVNVDVEAPAHHRQHHPAEHHEPEHVQTAEPVAEPLLVVGSAAPGASEESEESESTFDVPNDNIQSTSEDVARDSGDDDAVNDPDAVDDETAHNELEQGDNIENDDEIAGGGATKPTKPIHKVKKPAPKPPARKPAPKKSHKVAKPRTCRQEAVARAQTWADAKLQYCQAPYMARDYDSACSRICHRKSNPAWNKYRSDCSGLVSYAWKIAAPGLITTNFAPFSSAVTYSISATSLQPGDAVNNAEHVMLFKRWVHHPTVAEFLEEPGCSSSIPHAKTTESSVSISGSRIYIAAHGASFTAIRRRGCN